MKYKKNLSWVLLTGLLVSLFAGVNQVSAEMTPEETVAYYSYTIGEFVSGYEGYAYENAFNYASIEEFKTAENINVVDDGGISVVNGKPTFNPGTGNVSFGYPSTDANGIARPSGGKMYSVTEYSVSNKNTFQNMSSSTGVKHNSANIDISYRTEAGGEGFQPVTSEIKNFAANDILRYKFYLDATRDNADGLLVFTAWMENRTKDTGYILQKEDYNPRWGSTNTALVELTCRTATYSKGTGTMHSVAAYERFEYLLRDLVRTTETGMLQENTSLNRVETDLILTAGTFELDKGCTGTVSWTSTDEATINSATGAVERSTTEDKNVTLTATYSVSDGAETKEKVIEYNIFVPMNAPLRKLADEFTWEIINNGQSADHVRGNLNLVGTFSHDAVPDFEAEIAWNVLEGADAVTDEGVVTRMGDGDTPVKLQAILSNGGITVEKEFDFTVLRYVSPQEETDTVADHITWAAISGEPATKVTQNLSLLHDMETVDGNMASIEWNVLTGGNAIAADGTVTQQNHDTLAALEAIVSCGGAETKKRFDFVVLGANMELELFDVDFKKVGGQSENGLAVDESPYADTMSTSVNGTLEEGYHAKFIENKGLELHSVGANPDTDKLKLKWDMSSSAADPAILEKLKTITTYEITMYVVGKEQANARITLVDAQNNNAVMFTPRNDFVGIQAGGKWNPLGRAPWGTEEVYPTLFDGDNGPRIIFRADYNNDTGKLNAYAKLADYNGSDGYEEYHPLALNVNPNSSAVKGSLAGIELESCGTNSMIVERVRCYTTSYAVKDATAKLVESIDYLNGQDAGFITGNLEFPQVIDQYGSTLAWKTEPAGYFDSKGTLISRPAPYETAEVSIMPIVTFADASWASAAPVFPPKTVTVVGQNDNNIAQNKKVTISGAKAAEGSRADYVTDGSLDRGLVTSGEESRFDLIIDMGDALWNKIKITEGEPYRVAAYEISISDDRKNWEILHSGEGLQTKELMLEGDKGSRYLRLSVNEKTGDASPVTIAEIESFFEPSEAYRAAEDFKKITVPEEMVSQSFAVPAKGPVYGSEVTWKSSRTDILTVGSLNGDMYSINVSRPDYNTPVTLTAAIGNVSEKYQIIVQGKNYGGGGTGGGGGGNKVAGGGSAPYIPAAGNNGGNAEQPQGYFQDVSGWAEGYINKLYEKKIVSGDSQGNFNPETQVSRGEFIKMLILALEITPKTQTELPFTDVPAEHWAQPYIAAAYELGIVSGISDTEFGMDLPISRQDLAVMTDRALQKMGWKLPYQTEKKEFADADRIASYAMQSIENMQRYGIIGGAPDGGFHPAETATRAESAKILCGILKD